MPYEEQIDLDELARKANEAAASGIDLDELAKRANAAQEHTGNQEALSKAAGIPTVSIPLYNAQGQITPAPDKPLSTMEQTAVSPLGWLAGGHQQLGQGLYGLSHPESPRQMAGAASDVIRGGFTSATPYLLPAMLSNIPATALGLGTFTAAQHGIEWAGEKAGIPDEYNRLLGDLVGMYGGAKVHGWLNKLGEIPDQRMANSIYQKLQASVEALKDPNLSPTERAATKAGVDAMLGSLRQGEQWGMPSFFPNLAGQPGFQGPHFAGNAPAPGVDHVPGPTGAPIRLKGKPLYSYLYLTKVKRVDPQEALKQVLTGASEGIKIPPPFPNRNPTQKDAVQWIAKEGVHVDAPAASGSWFLGAAKKLAEATPVGAVIGEKGRQQTMEDVRALTGRLEQRATPEIPPGEFYDKFYEIEGSPESVRPVRTGKLDAQGKPITEDMQMPVPVGRLKGLLQPIFEQMQWMPAADRNASAGYRALEKIINGPNNIPASQAETGLGGIKTMAREADGRNRGIAKKIVPELQDLIDQSVREIGGEEAVFALQQGRKAAAKQAGADWLSEVFTRARAEGEYNRQDAVWNRWQNLPEDAKRTYFSPKQAADLNRFFLATKSLFRNVNPSGTAPVSAIGHLLAFTAHPLATTGEVLTGAAVAKLLHSKFGVKLLTEGLTIGGDTPRGRQIKEELRNIIGEEPPPEGPGGGGPPDEPPGGGGGGGETRFGAGGGGGSALSLDDIAENHFGYSYSNLTPGEKATVRELHGRQVGSEAGFGEEGITPRVVESAPLSLTSPEERAAINREATAAQRPLPPVAFGEPPAEWETGPTRTLTVPRENIGGITPAELVRSGQQGTPRFEFADMDSYRKWISPKDEAEMGRAGYRQTQGRGKQIIFEKTQKPAGTETPPAEQTGRGGAGAEPGGGGQRLGTPPAEAQSRLEFPDMAAFRSQISPKKMAEMSRAGYELTKGEGKQVVFEKPESIIDRTQASMNEAADAAWQRIQKRGNLSGTKTNALFPVDDAADMAIWGASKIMNGTINLAKWSKEMLADAGPEAAGQLRPLLPKMYEKSQKVYEQMLKSAAGNLPNLQKVMGMYEEGKAGEDWYLKTRAELEGHFGKHARIFLKFLAATSPNQTVAGNVTMALKAYHQWINGQPFTGFLVATNPKTGEVTMSVPEMLNKIVRGEEFGGRKVKSFDANIFGDPIPVTVDRWIYRAFGFPGSSPSENQYKFIDYAISQAAKRKGIEPRQMQAAIWKTIKEAVGKAGNTSDPFEVVLRKRLEADPILKEEIRRAVAAAK